jgi:four helix bundle protein
MGRFRGDLPVRTYEFAKRIVSVVEDLPNRNAGWVLGKQMLRSGTSIGANTCEADEALSEAEFIHRCSIARKEASETRYWLRLCRDCGLLTHDGTDDLIEEADEFVRILATSFGNRKTG